MRTICHSSLHHCQLTNFFLMAIPPNFREITEKTSEVVRKAMVQQAPTQDIATTEAIACKDQEMANVLSFSDTLNQASFFLGKRPCPSQNLFRKQQKGREDKGTEGIIAAPVLVQITNEMSSSKNVVYGTVSPYKYCPM